jgi:hypothetical protein
MHFQILDLEQVHAGKEDEDWRGLGEVCQNGQRTRPWLATEVSSGGSFAQEI